MAAAADLHPAKLRASADRDARAIRRRGGPECASQRRDEQPPFRRVAVRVNVMLGEQGPGSVEIAWSLDREHMQAWQRATCEADQRAGWRKLEECGCSEAAHGPHATVPPDGRADL